MFEKSFHVTKSMFFIKKNTAYSNSKKNFRLLDETRTNFVREKKEQRVQAKRAKPNSCFK
jgi:hypothetical protein